MSQQVESNLEDVIEVDFDIFEPVDSDLDGIIINLKQVLPCDIDTEEFAKLPIKFNDTSYLIKQATNEGESEEDSEDGDFIFGILAWIPLNATSPNVSSIMEKFKKYIVDYENRNAGVNGKGEGNVKFSDILSQDPLNSKCLRSGCLLNERFCTIPPTIAPQLFTQFMNDLKLSSGTNENVAAYEYIVCLTRIFVTRMDDPDHLGKKEIRKKGKKNERKSLPQNSIEVWMCPEMEIFTNLTSIDVPAKDASQNEDEGLSYSRFFVIPYSALQPCIERIVDKYGKAAS